MVAVETAQAIGSTRHVQEMGQSQESELFASEQEFLSLLDHIEVVLDSHTGPLGNLERLAEAPLIEGGEPEKRYKISLPTRRFSEEQEPQELILTRKLSSAKRDLAVSLRNPGRTTAEDEAQVERQIGDFYHNRKDLLARVPILVYESPLNPKSPRGQLPLWD